MFVAAIGIGSNSLRMLVANVENAQLHRIRRYREGLRVFAALDENGCISEEMMEKACSYIADFAEKAKADGAERIHLFATSAVRDASNQEQFGRRIQEATGLSPEICSGELEAKLSFLGATGAERSGMIDIGGGSTEIVVGKQADIELAASLQMGAVRLFRRFPITTAKNAGEVVNYAKTLLTEKEAEVKALGPVAWVGVGGTFTTLAALVQNIPWTSKESIHGFSLTREDVREYMQWLADKDLEHRMKLNGLQPQRADIVVHGVAVLLALMESLDIPAITVSEFGNLEGYLKFKYLS